MFPLFSAPSFAFFFLSQVFQFRRKSLWHLRPLYKICGRRRCVKFTGQACKIYSKIKVSKSHEYQYKVKIETILMKIKNFTSIVQKKWKSEIGNISLSSNSWTFFSYFASMFLPLNCIFQFQFYLIIRYWKPPRIS